MLLFIVHLKILKNLEKRVSIHLMLLFIVARSNSFFASSTFQYISCCYLSNSLQKLKLPAWFQYISCCYLSKINELLEMAKNKFQYISCCYLSRIYGIYRQIGIFVSIHLMLLFITVPTAGFLQHFPVSIHLMLLFICGQDMWRDLIAIVSIHLMLLFIPAGTVS